MRPNYSSDAWTVEPFDSKLDLWTLGAGRDFVWVLLAADPRGGRHRSLPREEGLTEIHARRGRHILGGRVQGADSKRGKGTRAASEHQYDALVLAGAT